MPLKTYSEHLRDSKGCCHRWRLLSLKPDINKSTSSDLSKYLVVPLYCNSKACKHCSAKYFRKIRHRFKNDAVKSNWRFFTLTSQKTSGTNEEQLKFLENNFRQLRKHLKRKFPTFEYIAVKELSPSGMWHIHGLWNIYIPVKDLSVLWKNYSGASIVWIEKLYSPRGAINYIFKYCFKSVDNHTELECLYNTSIKKFTTSRKLFKSKPKKSVYTCNLDEHYSVEELKQKLLKLIKSTHLTIEDFKHRLYPYFEDLLQEIFYSIYCSSELEFQFNPG